MQRKGRGPSWRNENLFLRIDKGETMRDVVIVSATRTPIGDFDMNLNLDVEI